MNTTTATTTPVTSRVHTLYAHGRIVGFMTHCTCGWSIPPVMGATRHGIARDALARHRAEHFRGER